MARAWYILHTLSGREKYIKNRIEKEVKQKKWDDIVLQVKPLIKEEIVEEEGKEKKRVRNLFPGYILIEMDVPDKEKEPRKWEKWKEVYTSILRINGVKGFLGMDKEIGTVRPLGPDDVKGLLSSIGEIEDISMSMVIDVGEGDKVRVKSGPFRGFVGTVTEIFPDKKKIKLLIDIFGRNTPVEIDISEIERV